MQILSGKYWTVQNNILAQTFEQIYEFIFIALLNYISCYNLEWFKVLIELYSEIVSGKWPKALLKLPGRFSAWRTRLHIDGKTIQNDVCDSEVWQLWLLTKDAQLTDSVAVPNLAFDQSKKLTEIVDGRFCLLTKAT